MKITKTLGAVVAASLLACAGEAAAASWIATYKGHVNSGSDSTGVFGSAGADLSGLEFVATFTYDTFFGSASEDGVDAVAIDSVLASKLKIGTQSWDFGSGFNNQIESHVGSSFPNGPGYIFHQVTGSFFAAPIFYNFTELTLAGGAAAPGLLNKRVTERAVVDPATGGAADSLGYFSIDTNFFGFANYASGWLRPETYSVNSTVPEPGAWALMILGFGGVGLAFRRRTAPA